MKTGMEKGKIYKNACTIDGKPYDLEFVSYSCKPWNCGFGGDLFNGDIEETVYKCPLCGEGKLVRVDENTPGDRDHWAMSRCEKCNPSGLVYKIKSGCVMDFITKSALEVAEKVKEEQDELSKALDCDYYDLLMYAKMGILPNVLKDHLADVKAFSEFEDEDEDEDFDEVDYWEGEYLVDP